MATRQKVREGVVVSDRMTKSVVVQVERRVKHPRYHKYLRLRTRYTAHDEQDRCRVGDRVRLVETRPLSKTKRWAVQAILERPEGAGDVEVLR